MQTRARVERAGERGASTAIDARSRARSRSSSRRAPTTAPTPRPCSPRCSPTPAASVRVGISGAPGAGKSTFIEALGLHLVAQRPPRGGARGRPVEHAQRRLDPRRQDAHGAAHALARRVRAPVAHGRHARRRRPPHARGAAAVRGRRASTWCWSRPSASASRRSTVAAMVDLFLVLVAPGGGDELQGHQARDHGARRPRGRQQGRRRPRRRRRPHTAVRLRRALHLVAPAHPGVDAAGAHVLGAASAPGSPRSGTRSTSSGDADAGELAGPPGRPGPRVDVVGGHRRPPRRPRAPTPRVAGLARRLEADVAAGGTTPTAAARSRRRRLPGPASRLSGGPSRLKVGDGRIPTEMTVSPRKRCSPAAAGGDRRARRSSSTRVVGRRAARTVDQVTALLERNEARFRPWCATRTTSWRSSTPTDASCTRARSPSASSASTSSRSRQRRVRAHPPRRPGPRARAFQTVTSRRHGGRPDRVPAAATPTAAGAPSKRVGTNLLDDPSVEGIVISARDLTDRRRAEADLREAQERFRSAFEHAPIGMALISLDGALFRVNRALVQILGAVGVRAARVTDHRPQPPRRP